MITLGIIGIVAALTMPALVADYRKSVVETRLKKFYSVMQQRQAMLTADEITQEDRPRTNDEAALMAWYKTYYEPYLKVVKTEIVTSPTGKVYPSIILYFPDGSAFQMDNDSWFFPEAGHIKDFPGPAAGRPFGKIAFATYFSGVPYAWSSDGTVGKITDYQELYNIADMRACNSAKWGYYCTRVIQLNGWKIPDDYPFQL